MRKIQYILSGITLITLPLGVHAQQQAKDSTVNRTVVVEQEYTPDIPDASKINVLPQVEAPTANKKAVEYDVTLVPANTIVRPRPPQPEFPDERHGRQTRFTRQ